MANLEDAEDTMQGRGNNLLCHLAMSLKCLCKSIPTVCHLLGAGVRAWASMTPPQILHAVAVEGRKPKFLDGTPADFMVRACR